MKKHLNKLFEVGGIYKARYGKGFFMVFYNDFISDYSYAWEKLV